MDDQFAGGGGGNDGRLKLRTALKIYLSPNESLVGPGLSAVLREPTRHQMVVPGVVKKLLLTVRLIGPESTEMVVPSFLVVLFVKLGLEETSTTYSTEMGSAMTTELNVNVI